MQIKELEDGLGAALFERSAREVRLAGFGEDFGHRARDILSRVDELAELVRASAERSVGRLRDGVTLIPEMAVPVETRSAAVSIARLPEPQPAA